MINNILNTCSFIYLQLGQSHNECVYHKALVYELNVMEHVINVEYEKTVPIFYKHSNGNIITVGSERIDLLITYIENDIKKYMLIELKATQTGIREHVEIKQLKKYMKTLQHLNVYVSHALIVNFPQQKNTEDIEYHTETNSPLQNDLNDHIIDL